MPTSSPSPTSTETPRFETFTDLHLQRLGPSEFQFWNMTPAPNAFYQCNHPNLTCETIPVGVKILEKYESLAISAILFAIAADLIGLAVGPNNILPTTVTGGLELIVGALLYIVTAYLLSAGFITAVAFSKFGTAPAISGILLTIATDLFNLGATSTDPTTKYVAWAIAGAIVSLTYWLIQQGLITARQGKVGRTASL